MASSSSHFRSLFNDNPVVVGGVFLLAIVLLATVLFLRTGRSGQEAKLKPITQAWFYDTVTKEIFVEAKSKLPPMINGAGHECVWVRYFSCGPCDGPERYIGYYEKYTTQLIKHLEATPVELQPRVWLEEGIANTFYSSDGETWHPALSPESLKVLKAGAKKCPGGRLNPCWPNYGDAD